MGFVRPCPGTLRRATDTVPGQWSCPQQSPQNPRPSTARKTQTERLNEQDLFSFIQSFSIFLNSVGSNDRPVEAGGNFGTAPGPILVGRQIELQQPADRVR